MDYITETLKECEPLEDVELVIKQSILKFGELLPGHVVTIRKKELLQIDEELKEELHNVSLKEIK